MIPSLFTPLLFNNRDQGGNQGVSIPCAQLNLHRSHYARDNFDLEDFKIHILQKPPYNPDKGHALSRQGFATYAAAPEGGKPPRAALRIANCHVSSALSQFMARDRRWRWYRLETGK